MPAKPCVVCHVGPRDLPDRERMGRPIKRVCRACHMARLRDDFRAALALHHLAKGATINDPR